MMLRKIGCGYACRGRRKAKEEIEGSHAQASCRLPICVEMIYSTNPSSFVEIDWDRDTLDVNPTFKRFFLCLEAMEIEFLEGCRLFLGLHGCHLKGPLGVFLSAVALDPNPCYVTLWLTMEYIPVST